MVKKIKVLIVDDHTMVREGLKKLLNTEEDIEVTGDAESSTAGLRMAKMNSPDIIVLDVGMPGVGGLEAIPLFKKVVPKANIIILSMYGKETFAKEALQSGASAYLVKGDSCAELTIAIRTVHKGGHYFSEELREILVTSFVGEKNTQQISKDNRYQMLTDREKQYFRLMMLGHSTIKISGVLEISPKTGQRHRTNIVKKLGMSSSIDLLKYAIRIGLVDPNSFNEA